jgi:hypothetical protein
MIISYTMSLLPILGGGGQIEEKINMASHNSNFFDTNTSCNDVYNYSNLWYSYFYNMHYMIILPILYYFIVISHNV